MIKKQLLLRPNTGDSNTHKIRELLPNSKQLKVGVKSYYCHLFIIHNIIYFGGYGNSSYWKSSNNSLFL